MMVAFANNFTFYLKAHNYHWTVSGETFKQDHEFLGEIYAAAQENIDGYAEQLRRIGAFPQGDIQEIVKNASIIDAPLNEMREANLMYLNLLADLDVIVPYLQDVYDEAGVVREYGLQNFLAERIDEHRKQQWMLTASVVDEADYIVPGTTPPPPDPSEYCHKMQNPDTGLMVEVETPEEHDAAIAAGYTVEVKE
jgi:starvation-inducible DNA-binding protein